MKQLHFLFKPFMLLLLLGSQFTACSTDNEPEQECPHKYTGGFYVVNQGNFADGGNINYCKDGAITKGIFTMAGMKSTGVFGMMNNHVFYTTQKSSAVLTAIDAYTFQPLAAVEVPDAQGHTFCLLPNGRSGILTTSKGAFIVHVQPDPSSRALAAPAAIALGKSLEGTENSSCTDAVVAGDYLFVINSLGEVRAYNASSLEFLKTVGNANTGFARTMDGTLWAASSFSLLKINVQTLTSEEINLPKGFEIWYDKWAYGPSPLCASTTENALFLPKVGTTDVYKYTLINSSLATPFAVNTLDGYSFFGQSITINPTTGDLYTILNKAWGKENAFVIFDSKTGRQKEVIDYSDEEVYFFPSMIVF